ncbi:hypothetical protein O166_03930 [Pseudogulbenkiania ferrooxidans EGD-HP2]|uniref:Uncharacterized protein n=1 Tax=Pseudogulbenkiania ferrooxidans EGD-HP2 TaxID=1388764 RepID=A0ABN0NA11_9NEIS|nr:hypothetical protein O166_03930 [Pseudogulbenkiania ferrooxidans EGD-HP2]
MAMGGLRRFRSEAEMAMLLNAANMFAPCNAIVQIIDASFSMLGPRK